MEENQLLLTMAERNVVILGKVGTGKRTLGNHIVGQDIFQQESLFDAGNANHHYKQHWAGDTFYRILTVDIESLQTSYRNPLPYIRERLQTVHLIIFVIANGRYTDESHNSLMRAVKDLHSQAKPFSALVITHCEGITEESRRDIVNEFKVNSRSSEVAAFIGKQIFGVGLPDISKVSTHFKSIYQNGITKDEIAIRRLVKDSYHPLNVKDLPAVQSRSLHFWKSLKCCSCLCLSLTLYFLLLLLLFPCFALPVLTIFISYLCLSRFISLLFTVFIPE